jgi:hypothetical protein
MILIPGSSGLDHDYGATDWSVFSNPLFAPQPSDATNFSFINSNSLLPPPQQKKLKITVMVLADPNSLKRYVMPNFKVTHSLLEMYRKAAAVPLTTFSSSNTVLCWSKCN